MREKIRLWRERGVVSLLTYIMFAKSFRGRSTHRFRCALVCGPNGLASSEFPKVLRALHFPEGNDHYFILGSRAI